MRLLARILPISAAVMTKRSFASMSTCSAFIEKVNTEYESLHRSFEEQFWGTKMALSDPKYSVPELTHIHSPESLACASRVALHKQTRQPSRRAEVEPPSLRKSRNIVLKLSKY